MIDSTTVPSLIRTWTPILVGALISWLISLGISVSDEAQAGLVILMTAVLQGVYYTLVRWAESRWPWASRLLGSSQIPAAYTPDGTPPADPPAGD